MGEVYRARDARLDRDVALKVLPTAVSADPDRLSRFRREAQVLASLNHPNIAAIYGLEEMRTTASHSTDVLVLELVDGQTLEERIAAGPVPFEEAREIAIQIASAVEAAHERGIVHRDLKPANVKVRPDGTVKVLDFGLAKALQPAAAQQSDMAASPTFTSPAMTGGGVILGTAAYMSPEQARGAQIDRRTDVWAFGCVLFEMLAGRHVFGSVGTVSDAIAAVLKSEPQWDALPADTPSHVRALLKRCLDKDPRRRLRDIGDAGLLLGELGNSEDPLPRAAPARPAPARWPRHTAWGAAMLALVAIGASIGWVARDFRPRSTATQPSLHLTVSLSSPLMAANVHRPLAISPDGTRIAYVARDGDSSSLFLQDLVNGELKRLPETTGADAPAFSPDGRTIGFKAGATIKMLPLDGLPRDIQGIDGIVFDWAWSDQEHIVVAGQKGVARLRVAGGSPEVIVPLVAGEVGIVSVTPLPGGAFVAATRATAGMDDVSKVVVVAAGSQERVVIAEKGGSPAFVARSEGGIGHIVYGHGGRLMAVPFDSMRRVVLGGPAPVVENVAMRPNGDGAEYRVARNGTLIFREATLHELVWVDRTTQSITPVSANLRRFALPRLSPNGRRLAVEIQDSPHQIWMLDLERDLLTPLTTDAGGAHNFAWSPDGTAIVYTLGSVKPPQLGWVRTEGSPSPARIEIPGEAGSMVDHWSRDNRVLVMSRQPSTTMSTLTLTAGTPPRVAGAPVKISAGVPGSLSPDGSWVAYCDCWDTAKKTHNAYIRHLQSGSEYQVSVQGGSEPAWAPNGRELFFRTGSKMMSAPLTFDGSTVKIGRARTLFEGEYLEWASANYDVSRDGTRFLMVRATTSHQRSLAVRLNWTTELSKMAPAR